MLLRASIPDLVGPQIDRSQAPIIVVSYPRVLTEAHIGPYFDEVTAIVSQQPSVFLIDVRSSAIPGPRVRRAAATRLNTLYTLHPGCILGVAHLVSSTLVRGALTAVYWLAPPPCPTLFTAEMEMAMTWAERLVQRSY